jgi:hypothetical protein
VETSKFAATTLALRVMLAERPSAIDMIGTCASSSDAAGNGVSLGSQRPMPVGAAHVNIFTAQPAFDMVGCFGQPMLRVLFTGPKPEQYGPGSLAGALDLPISGGAVQFRIAAVVLLNSRQHH